MNRHAADALKLVKFVVLIFFMAHTCACGWMLVATLEKEEDGSYVSLSFFGRGCVGVWVAARVFVVCDAQHGAQTTATLAVVLCVVVVLGAGFLETVGLYDTRRLWMTKCACTCCPRTGLWPHSQPLGLETMSLYVCCVAPFHG